MYNHSIIEQYSTNPFAAQAELEALLLKNGYDKELNRAATNYKRTEEGGLITSLPKGTEIFLDVLQSFSGWYKAYIEEKEGNRNPIKFYKFLVKPYMDLYQQEMDRSTKFRPCIYDNPLDLMGFFVTRELTSLMVIGSRKLTELARAVVDGYCIAYNHYNGAEPDELAGMIQLFRSYVESDANRFFDIKMEVAEFKRSGSLYIGLKEEYEDLHFDRDEILSSIDNNHAAYKPMLVEPLEHSNLLDGSGGYLELGSPILKRPVFEILRQMPQGKQEWFDTLNRMQNTQWQINTPFLNWLKECHYDPVMKYFHTDAKALTVAGAKQIKSITRAMFEKGKQINLLTKEMKDKTNTSVIRQMEIDRLNLHDEVDLLEVEVENIKRNIGRVRGWETTIQDAEFYSNFPCFYHPLFCDNRGRIYTYNTSLSFQGNSLAKSLVCAHHKERMSQDGLQGVLELLGGMFEGYSKKSKEVRISMVSDRMPQIFNVITHEDYSLLSEIDEDELLCALVLMFELYQHYHIEGYETGLLAYIDSTSSAIQIQAICQRCVKAASLTNLIAPEGDDLPDAYQEVANDSSELITVIAGLTDEDLINTLSDYYSQVDPDKLAFMGNIQ